MAQRDMSFLGPEVSTTPSVIPDNSVVIKGKYVTLKAMDLPNTESLLRNLDFDQNPELFDYMPAENPTSAEEFWKEIEDLQKKNVVHLYAVFADPKRINPSPGPESWEHTEVLGMIGFGDIQTEHRTIEIGGIVFATTFQRSLAATEAHYLQLCSLLDEGSPSLAPGAPPYRRVAWRCNKLNQKSRRAAERMGYVFEGTFRNAWIVKGRTRDTDWFSITEGDWPIAKAALQQWMGPTNFDQGGRQIRSVDEIRAALKQERKS